MGLPAVLVKQRVDTGVLNTGGASGGRQLVAVPRRRGHYWPLCSARADWPAVAVAEAKAAGGGERLVCLLA